MFLRKNFAKNIEKGLFYNGILLGVSHLIGYYKNDFPLGYILTYKEVG